MTPERRMVVALLLSFGIYVAWGYLFVGKHKHEPPPKAPAEHSAVASPSPAPPPPVVAPAAVAAASAAPEQLVELNSPELHLVLSSRGGVLAHAELKAQKYQRRVEDKDEPVDLARATPEGSHPLETSFGGALASASAAADYQAQRDPDGQGVRFIRSDGQTRVEKHFFLVSPYLAELDVQVSGAQPEYVRLTYPGVQPPGSTAAPGLFSFGRTVPNVATGICRVAGTVERGNGGRAGDIKVASTSFPKTGQPGPVDFIGLDERFFVGAVFPEGDHVGRCSVASLGSGTVNGSLELPLTSGTTKRFGVYLGPKDYNRLRQDSRLPGGTGSADLQSSVEFGFWTALCVPMLLAMEFFHGFARNWGVVIILLTLAIKLVLLPLQHRVYKSMEQMKKLAPQLEELKKKHGNDRERLSMEQMKLYSEHGANPFGSCLPMLLQIPIWIALYRLLGTTIQLYREPFLAGWISDLTAPDPFYILPIGMGATMIVTQLLTPQTLEGAQQKFLMWFMPIFMTVTFLKVPAGLSLYIFASNLLNIAQQYWLTRRFRGPPASANGLKKAA